MQYLYLLSLILLFEANTVATIAAFMRCASAAQPINFFSTRRRYRQ
jgi:hypothetical protein